MLSALCILEYISAKGYIGRAISCFALYNSIAMISVAQFLLKKIEYRPEVGKPDAGCGIEMSSHVIDDHELAAMFEGAFWQRGRRINKQSRAEDEEQVGCAGFFHCLTESFRGEAFAEKRDIRLENGVTFFAPGDISCTDNCCHFAEGHEPAAPRAMMQGRRAMDFDDATASCFLMQQVNILRDDGFQDAPLFQLSKDLVNDRRPLVVQPVDEVPGHLVIEGGVLSENVDIEDLVSIGSLVKSVPAAEIADAGEGAHSCAGERDAMVGGEEHVIEGLEVFGAGAVTVARYL